MTTDETIMVKSDKISNLNKWYKFAAICVASTCVILLTLSTIAFALYLNDHSGTSQSLHSLTVLEHNANTYIISVASAANKIFNQLHQICIHTKGCVYTILKKK